MEPEPVNDPRVLYPNLIQTFQFYLVNLFNPALVLFAVLALVFVWGNRSRFILAASLIVAGFAAFAPGVA